MPFFAALVYFQARISPFDVTSRSAIFIVKLFCSALDKNEYNHITATYFLMAERKLRAQRQEQMQKARPEVLDVSSRYFCFFLYVEARSVAADDSFIK